MGHPSLLRHAFQQIDFVLQPQISPALQNDRDVSVLPEEIVERAEAEFVLFLALRVGEEFVDLQLADLVRNRLTGDRSEESRFCVRRACVHGHGVLEILGRLRDAEFTERELHVDFHAQRSQPHEVPDDFARARAVVEQAGVQHHLFCIKADALVGAGIVVVTANRVGMTPGERKLKVVSGHALMHNFTARVFGRGQRKVAERRTWRVDVACAVLIQPIGRSEVVAFCYAFKWRKIGRHGLKAIVLHPIGNGENVFLLQIAANCQLVFFFMSRLLSLILEQRQRRSSGIAVFFIDLRIHRSRPFLTPLLSPASWSLNQKTNSGFSWSLRSYPISFLLNDIVRFWRTMAVDFASKQRYRGGKGWGLRNAKLRMSRKLIFAAGLLVCFSANLDPALQSEISNEKNDIKLKLANHLRNQLVVTPLEILARSIEQYRVPEATAKKLFGAYAEFLELLDDERSRESLKNLRSEKSRTDEVFQKVRQFGGGFERALNDIFFENPSIAPLTRKYGVF